MTPGSSRSCPICNARELIEIDTYKRHWYLCEQCGGAHPVQKRSYPLSFLPYEEVKRLPGVTESSIYDYFTDPATIPYAVRSADEFLERYIDARRIDLTGKRILDVSGGNGHFLKQLTLRGATGVLTEINEPALRYAKATHGFDVYAFDLNRDRVHEVIHDRFDVVLLRAAIMFCLDMPRFLGDLATILEPDALVIVNHSVMPTLGTLLRVQLDEFTYLMLRQPETVIDAAAAAGFECTGREDETDQSLYLYDDDLSNLTMTLHYLYEIRAALRLRAYRKFAFPARDRRRSTMFFRTKR